MSYYHLEEYIAKRISAEYTDLDLLSVEEIERRIISWIKAYEQDYAVFVNVE